MCIVIEDASIEQCQEHERIHVKPVVQTCTRKFFVQCGAANCLLGSWGPVIPFACKQLQLVYQQYEKESKALAENNRGKS